MGFWMDPTPARRINGCGTIYYGWQHADDGTAEVTCWFCLVFFPIIPLRHYRLKLFHDPSDDPRPSFWAFREGFRRAFSQECAHPSFVLDEVLSFDFKSILSTYLNAFVLFPALFFVLPYGILRLIRLAIIAAREHNHETLAAVLGAVGLGCVVVWLVGFIFSLMKVLDYSKGDRPRFFRGRQPSTD